MFLLSVKRLLFSLFFCILIIGCVNNKSAIQINENQTTYSNKINNLSNLYNEVLKLMENTLFQIEDEYFVFDSYGFSIHPINGNIIFRNYTFINSIFNSKIFSISNGKIVDAGYDFDFGLYVKVNYDELEIIYGNLYKIEINVNDTVSIGDIIGYGGMHFGMFGNGITIRIKYRDYYLNPYVLLNYDNNRSYR